MKNSAEKRPLVYLDTGALSRLRHIPIEKIGATLAFSEATLLDLRNSEDASPELAYLNSNNALFLRAVGGKVQGCRENPWELLERLDALDADVMGPLLTFFSGGGPDQTAQDSLNELLEGRLVPILGPSWSSIIDSELQSPTITNREIESAIDKGKGRLPPKSDDVISDLKRSLPDAYSAALDESLPPSPREFEHVHMAALALKLSGLAPSKGVRSRNKTKSLKVGTNDYVDTLHVAYGLHCQVFITTDKSVEFVARCLKQYWGLFGEIGFLELNHFVTD